MNVIRYHIFDTRPDTEYNSDYFLAKTQFSRFPPPHVGAINLPKSEPINAPTLTAHAHWDDVAVPMALTPRLASKMISGSDSVPRGRSGVFLRKSLEHPLGAPSEPYKSQYSGRWWNSGILEADRSFSAIGAADVASIQRILRARCQRGSVLPFDCFLVS